ncbi:MAG: tol-pal system protein YbgF [Acidobacteriota bacterium]|jgi:tol-pal system protein YbgF
MRRLIVPLLAVTLTGCVSTDDISLLHREITDVGRRVDELGRQSSGKEDLDVMSRRLAEQNAQVLRSNADIQQEIARLRDALETLQASLGATNQRLESLTLELAAARERVSAPPTALPPGGGAGAPLAGPAGVLSEPAALYRAAYEDYLRGNFDLAIQGFSEYNARYPNTELADDALYWIGECHMAKRNFQGAVDTFTTLLNTHKTSDKAAAALLKKGLALLEMGDRSQAVINLQYVLYEHPGSKEAALARERLAALGVNVR